MKKRNSSIWKTFFIMILVSSIIIPQSWTQEKEKKEEKEGSYYEGKRDGEIAGGADNAMVTGGATGCCLGCLGYALVPMAEKEPPYAMMKDIEHKSEDYKAGFRDGYKGKKKSQFITGVTIGWLTSLAILVIVYSNSEEEEY